MIKSDTEKKLIHIIVAHHLGDGRGKLLIRDLCARAGITRQIFHRRYGHLKIYVQGKLPAVELIASGADDIFELFAICQRRLVEQQKEIDFLQNKCNAEIRDFKESHLTTLMNHDITFIESNELRVMLERQALHNEILANENRKISLELSASKARVITLSSEIRGGTRPASQVDAIEPDLTAVFRDYFVSKDLDVFERDKESVLDNMLIRINKFCRGNSVSVVVYVERYVSSFEKFVDYFRKSQSGSFLIVRVPVYTREELKIFSRKISDGRSINVHVPHCASESVAKAQRKFLFRDVPDCEFTAADMLPTPSIRDGYDSVVIFLVNQGD